MKRMCCEILTLCARIAFVRKVLKGEGENEEEEEEEEESGYKGGPWTVASSR